MNASSKEERDSWIEVIRNASPSSPRMKKAAEAAKLKEEHRPAKSPESSEDRLRPSPVERQTTATDAAVAAAQYMDAEAEEKQIEEVKRGLVWSNGRGQWKGTMDTRAMEGGNGRGQWIPGQWKGWGEGREPGQGKPEEWTVEVRAQW